MQVKQEDFEEAKANKNADNLNNEDDDNIIVKAEVWL